MNTPSFQNFLIVLTGWVFAPRRTITGMLVAAGVAGNRHHVAFHWLFAKAQWTFDQLRLILFRLILPWLDPGGVDGLHDPQ